MWNEFSGRKLCKILFIKFFTSDIVNAGVNIILPVIISIRCTSYSNTHSWWAVTICSCIFICIFNIVSVFIKNYKNKANKNLNLTYKCYAEQRSINEKFTTQIYRLNNLINQYLTDNKPVNKKAFDKVADFQTYSFSICESIHKILSQEYGTDIKCEVTLMKKCGTSIKMLSYCNNGNLQPSSYIKSFSCDDADVYFAKLFNDLNGKPSCLPNKKAIAENFKKLPGSEKRESEICQYIGVPIRTHRNQIELLLQIDVSKEKVFGKNEKQMELFVENVIYPYVVLLHKAYERDLIFTQYFDMIVAVLKQV